MKAHTVLIVDDQVINRRILKKLLAPEYDLLEAADGAQALTIMKEHADTISAVLLDIVMPVMDGYAVLRCMAADPELRKLPVIVSSQQDDAESEVRALSLGAQDFIAKPYKADIILHRLHNTIRLRETAAMVNRTQRDALTGLYNKPFFLENVEEQLRRAPEKRYDLLCVGIERFKLINETYGTAKGDDLLRWIADILRAAAHTLPAARFDADWFYLLLPHSDAYTEERFAPWLEKVRQFPMDMDVKLYCGIYPIQGDEKTVSVMCDRAQLAAGRNKGQYGSAFSIYDDSLRQKLMDEQFVTSHMRTALEEHEFQVYYQPKYDLNNELVAGAEALVRWIHPEKGMLSPGMFIPLFESNGFITQLDQYVWECACRDIREWMDQGQPPLAISVNVSRADIYNPHLADILLALVAKYRVPLRYLHLEITESAYTNNPDQIIRVVNRLRGLGFIIEMDDFGSGYSSLNMLAEMPVDVLKLDMGFIQHETGNVSGRGILSFVISLAKWLNLAVVAEGVETAEQIAALRSMDCNYVQGFYFARPMKKEDFAALLRSTPTTEMICTSQTARQYVETMPPVAVPASARVMLIVDDIELNRAVLASTFAGQYVVVEKENGAAAWDYLQKNIDRVGIVMLDLLMPVMDGFQLLEKIRADARTKELPVIITSQGDAGSEQRALEMQADDFISKPYNPEIIRHRVRNVIESYRLRSLQRENRIVETPDQNAAALTDRSLSDDQRALLTVDALKPHFDIVRLVDAENTMVCSRDPDEKCDMHACYSVWGKSRRCNNCISLQALRTKGRCSKLEYSASGLFFVVSEYVPFGKTGAVIEMVTRLDDAYVDNIFDKKLLYASLDAIHEELDSDTLTGVFNRRHINAHLEGYVESARAKGRSLCLGMVDIDSLKLLNDAYGHLTGDRAIRTVAEMLRDNIVLHQGDFVARFGGDEFMVVCQDRPLAEFAKELTAVARLTEHITAEDGTAIPLGISAGCVALAEFPRMSGQELVERADRRLYHAKQTGRGQVSAAD